MSVSFDMDNKVLKGTSMITIHEEGQTVLHSGSLKIRSLKLNGRSTEPVVKDGDLQIKTGKNSVIDIEYECLSGENSPCIINEKGILLTGNWYPSTGGLARYRLRALIPPGLSAVSEAESIETEKSAEGDIFSFNFPHPVDNLNLIASTFAVKKESFNGVDVYAYFFPEDIGLADTYLAHTKNYLTLYEAMLGPFPFKRFSIVENFLSTGYSLPTFTLLGQDVVRLPFIVKTSLGHEILHQWLGNCLYIDYEKGNWAEGLTTYLSDHLYEEQEGRAWQYRKQILIDYDSYVVPEKELSLKDFKSRDDFASKAIGYGKSAMVFHMLKRLVGSELFSQSLRNLVETKRFQKTSWDDIRKVFETVTERKLDWFFKQWVKEKGSPVIEIGNIETHPKGLQTQIAFDIIQNERTYTIDVPVSVKTDKGEVNQTFPVTEKKHRFSLVVDGKPEKLVIDENYDIFRTLSRDETPPVIAKLLGEDEGLLVLADGKDTSRYSKAAEFFLKRNYSAKKPNEVKNEDLRKSSVIVLGSDNAILKGLFGRTEQPPSGLSMSVKQNPLNQEKVIAIVNTDSEEEIQRSLGKIIHYGNYSMIAFREGQNIEKKTSGSERGLIEPLGEVVIGFELAKALSLNDIINSVSQKKIVYVGEHHDQYEDHIDQLEVIRELFKKNPKIAIGMEMFQRPYQKALDDYIGGTIDEREFLRASEYFDRWGFDYNFYKDILRFAREERIPVIALNIKREIVEKVSSKGIDSLTADEKKDLPDSMDMTDEAYKESLRDVFEKHEGLGEKNFDNFYQSQIIWDEIMSQSIDEFLKKNPDRQIIVLTGGGHLDLSFGIPKRTFRRNGLAYAVILSNEPMETGIADFMLYPEAAKINQSPKLMVMLKVDKGRVKIVGFPENSIAEKAGMKADDVIVSLDNTKVTSVDDIKIFLFYKKSGDTIRVKVLRKGFLVGEREREFDVTL
jgi:uncharacterized iron-regulated protein